MEDHRSDHANRKQDSRCAALASPATLETLSQGEGGRPAFYPGLDVLRGFAAVSVVIYHVIAHFNWKTFPTSNAFCLWFHAGWMGVDLFFVISGFVIALSALNLIDRDPGQYAQTFCTKRLARIVPLHYLTCLVWVLFVTPGALSDRNYLWHVFSHLAFIHNWMHETAGSINGPNWSLGVEMQFYLFVLLAAPLLRRMRPLGVLGIGVAVAWIWRAGAFALYHGQMRDGVNMTWLGISQVPGMLDEFSCGIALALFLHQDPAGRKARFLHATRWLWPLATYLAATITMRFFWSDATYWGNPKMVILWRTSVAVTFLLAVISACALDDRWLVRLTAPLRYLGTISYGIYLWHSLVILTILRLIPGNPPLACFWVVALTLLLAAASWEFFEKPLLERYGRRAASGSRGLALTRLSRAIWRRNSDRDDFFPVAQSRGGRGLRGSLRRSFERAAPFLFAVVAFWPALQRIARPTLLGDDITRLVDLVKMPFVAHLFRQFSGEIAPFFQLVSWLIWQAIGHDIRFAPLGFCLAAVLAWGLVLVLLTWWLWRETGSRTASLVAVAIVARSPLVLQPVWWYSASSVLWAAAGILIAIVGAGAILQRPRWSVLTIAIGSALAPAANTLGVLAAPLAMLRAGLVLQPRPFAGRRGWGRRLVLIGVAMICLGYAVPYAARYCLVQLGYVSEAQFLYLSSSRCHIVPILGAAAVIAAVLAALPLVRRCDQSRGDPALFGTLVGLAALLIQHREAASWEWMLHQPDQMATFNAVHRVGELARREGVTRLQLVRIFDPCFRTWNGSVLRDHPDTFHLMELAISAPEETERPLPDDEARDRLLGHLSRVERLVLGSGTCVSLKPPKLPADARAVRTARRVELFSAREAGHGRYRGDSGSSYVEFEFDITPEARYLALPGLKADQDVVVLRREDDGRWLSGQNVRWLESPTVDGPAAIDLERVIHWSKKPVSRIRVQFTRPGEIALTEPPQLLR